MIARCVMMWKGSYREWKRLKGRGWEVEGEKMKERERGHEEC
jgi:hypothetical protein